jgi:hypothetical protein
MSVADGAVLAQLLAQSAGQGADLLALRAIVEEAGDLAAGRALARLGLEDRHAAKDMAELRELLAAWRAAKTSLWKAAIGWVAKMALVLMLAGLAVKLRLWELLK